MKKLLALLLALTMVVALVACGSTNTGSGQSSNAGSATSGESSGETSGDGETYNIILNLHKGEMASAQEKAYMEAVTEATGGRVTWEVYYANSLLKPAEVPEGLATGVIDMGVVNVAEYPSIIPLAAYVLTMPFSGLQGEAWHTVADQVIEEYPEIKQEFADGGMMLLAFHYSPSTNLFFAKDVDCHQPSDLKGKNVIATSAAVQTMIQNAGGSPVSAGPPDFYSYLERSVSDGIINHWGQVYNSALYEVSDTAVIFGEDTYHGISREINAMVISPAKWNSLPADIQEALVSCASVYREAGIQVVSEMTQNGTAALESEGVNIIYLSDDEVAVWQEAFAPLCEGILSDLDSKGVKATEIYNRMLEINAGLN